MAITIDWPTKVITVPKADTSLVSLGPPEVRQIDVGTAVLDAVRALEASEEGIVFDKAVNHNTTVTVGGVTLARVVELINNYTVTFESGTYRVNLEGANNNVIDSLNYTATQVASKNSAGLQEVDTGGSAAATATAVWSKVIDGTREAQQVMRLLGSFAGGKSSGGAANTPIVRDIDDTKNRITATTNAAGDRLSVTLDLD